MDSTLLVLSGLGILVGGVFVLSGIVLLLLPLEGVQDAVARFLGRPALSTPTSWPKATRAAAFSGGAFLAVVGIALLAAIVAFLFRSLPAREIAAQERTPTPGSTVEPHATQVPASPPATHELELPRTPEPSQPPGQASPTSPPGMVPVEDGRFLMGSNTLGRTRSPAPSHPVNLPTYYIHQYEVANGDYELCVADGACYPPTSSSSSWRPDYYGLPEYDTFPVVNVTRSQAQAYCDWIGGSLPTEAQWEKAARGTAGWDYPWGDELPSPGDSNLAFPGTARPVTHRVGAHTRDQSPYGVFDLAGNVSEWTASWYVSYDGNPQPFDWEGILAVIRGGNFSVDPTTTIYGRTYQRSSMDPLASDPTVGFRCVWPPPD
jgi:formylglycine-generating enzyme required for sulfatase activity